MMIIKLLSMSNSKDEDQMVGKASIKKKLIDTMRTAWPGNNIQE